MKKMNKLPIITGDIGIVFNRELIYRIATITNAQSKAINYLVEVIESLEKKVEYLERKIMEEKKQRPEKK